METKSVNHLPKDTQVVSGKAQSWTQAAESQDLSYILTTFTERLFCPFCYARLIISFRCDWAYFKEKEIEAQRSERACPESHSPQSLYLELYVASLKHHTNQRKLL